jgi:hypothetical protein
LGLLICLQRNRWQISQVHCKWINQASKFGKSVNYICAVGWLIPKYSKMC